jgi:magnesium transporter
VDDYAPVVAGLERDIDEIEAIAFSGEGVPTERIYSLRSEATAFYRAAHPLLGVVATIERTTAAPELQPSLRNIQSHLLVIDEELAAQRELLGSALQDYVAIGTYEQTRLGLRQNSTIEQLTILATIFLPLTFITGVFGQNFAWRVQSVPTYTAVIFYVVPLVLLFWWLRTRMQRADNIAAGQAAARWRR